MTSTKRAIPGAIACGAVLSLAGACGSDTDGDGGATLSIVGDQAHALDSGDNVELTVSYTEDDDPLEGEVEFSIEGDAHGASLVDQVVQTDAVGEASTTLVGDNEEAASFQVEASAPDAASVTWNISIEEPIGPGDPNGTYRVESSLDLVPGLEGDVGSILQVVVEFGDEPGEALIRYFIYLAEELSDALPGGIEIPIPDEIDPELLGPFLSQILEEHAGDFYNDVAELGSQFSQISQDFGLVTELEISVDGDSGTGDHALTGVQLRHDGEVDEHTMADMELEDEVDAVDVDIEFDEEEGTIELEIHGLPASYGQMLLVAFEEAILPQLDSEASTLAEFGEEQLDGACETLATELVELLTDEGEDPHEDLESMIESGCDLLVAQGFQLLENQIRDFGDDEADIVLSLEGEGVAQDTLGDGNTDTITGSWEGAFEVGGNVVITLDSDDTSFEADRE